jgi:hypothetical protein
MNSIAIRKHSMKYNYLRGHGTLVAMELAVSMCNKLVAITVVHRIKIKLIT